MAGLALSRDVLATQNVFRVAIVVEGGGLPVLLHVTGLALVAEAPLVAFLVVVGLVAGDARRLEFFQVQESGVASLAFGLDVLAAQNVFRVAVMVKGGNGPILLGVAGLALVAEAPLMAFLVVVGFMAGYTGGFEFFLE